MKIQGWLRTIFSRQISTDIYTKNIINHVPHCIFWKNTHGVFLGCNIAFAESGGFRTAEEIIGKTDYEMPWRENADHYLKDDKQVMSRLSNKLDYEETQRQLDGTKKVMLVSKVPILNEPKNEVLGVLGVYTDITDRKETEAALLVAKEMAESASRAKTEFIENMRHDIRTPLCGIVGLSDILKRESDKPQIKEYAELLAKSGERLLKFLNEILDSMNVSTGEIPLVKKRFELREILEDVVDLHRAMAADRKLGLNFYFDETIPQYLIGDPMRVYRIVLELLANALKFTEEGEVNVYARLDRKEGRQLIVKVIIEDTGIGIAEDKQQELFIRFKSLTPSYKGIYQGSGLGLSIAKQFLDDLGAEIYIESALKKGTRFTCVFEFKEALFNEPMNSVDDLILHKNVKSIAAKQPMAAVPRAPGVVAKSSTNILIVEDDSIAAMVLRNIFESLGCAVEVVGDGGSAVAASQARDYDLIFMDIGLPGMDGFEATVQIRAAEAQRIAKAVEEGSHRNFIAGLTAHAEPDAKRRGLNVGM